MIQGILQILNGALNALHQPIKASLLNLTQMLVVYIPLAVWSSKTFGIIGIFISLVASYFIVGTIGHYLFKRSLKQINTVKGDIIKENLKSA